MKGHRRPDPHGSDNGHLPETIGVAGDGFLPGEDVLIAPIADHATADEHGNVHYVVDPATLAASRGLVLLGAVSGTVHLIQSAS